MKKVAFCFLLYDTVKHNKTWTKFFKEDKHKSASIYTHVKQITDKTQDWVKSHQIKPIKTAYCDVSLVFAWIKLLQAALKDPGNHYFTILSGECIPLFSYPETYSKIIKSSKSRINHSNNAESYHESGYYWADQWVLLTRREAKLLVKLKTTKKGRDFSALVEKKTYWYCPDEILPINWFVKHYGKPSSSKYRKYIRSIPTTYTLWPPSGGSPIKFNAPKTLKNRKVICKSKALFARKFNKRAAKALGMTC